MPLPRHSLVWPNKKGWESLKSSVKTERDSQLLQTWQQNNFPLVVRRSELPLGPNMLAVGLPNPVAKQRIFLTVDAQHIAKTAAPLLLVNALAYAPLLWQGKLQVVIGDAELCGLTLRVFGSLAWQALTEIPYINDNSDIDLLIYIETCRDLENAVALLNKHGVDLPLDGELIFNNERGVSWKEYMTKAGNQKILVKSIDGVSLLDQQDLVAGLKQ